MAISPDDAARAERRRAQRAASRAAARRRRLVALGAIAAAAAVGGAIVGAGGDDEDRSPTAAPALTCPTRIAANPRRLAGQMLIVRMEAAATEGLRRRVRRGAIGGVILFPPAGTRASELRREIASLRQAAERAGVLQPLVMIDQEGGEVKRLPSLPPDRPPPSLGAGGEATAFDEGRATGAELAAIGIDVDLAPVLAVPTSADAFIASRAFGSEPAEVARTGVAFGEGLQAAGVAATAKHFPGLGGATVNTDLAPSTIEETRAERRSALEPFRAAIAGGLDLVMVASAAYPAYDPQRIASRSPRVIEGLLRRRLGFDGAVVTDDLGAQALVQAGIGEAEAAVGAAQAGADLLLFAQSSGGAAGKALARALRRGELEREVLIGACARASALREPP
jgi:beta-N-acetylhexosaminidase